MNKAVLWILLGILVGLLILDMIDPPEEEPQEEPQEEKREVPISFSREFGIETKEWIINNDSIEVVVIDGTSTKVITFDPDNPYLYIDNMIIW